MTILVSCIYKDILEFIRNKKNVLCAGVLLLIGAMVLCTTLFFPSLIDQVMQKSPDIISDPGSINELMGKLFPSDVKGSMGILSSDIGVFYTILIALSCGGIIPEERKSGRWIIPQNMGINPFKILLSKCIVYGAGTAFPGIVIYNLYFYVACYFLKVNHDWRMVIMSSLVLGLGIFSITVMTIMMSVIYNSGIVSALSVIVFIIAAPDILSFFSFGKYFPTYVLTFLYTSDNHFEMLLIPILTLVVCVVLMGAWARRKVNINGAT